MKRNNHKARLRFRIAVITVFILIIAIIIALIFVFTMKPGSQKASATPESTTSSSSSLNESNAASTDTNTSSTNASSTADPSSNASNSGTSVNTNNFIPHSAEVDNSFFNNTLIIGNSITEGFEKYSGLTTPTYYDGRGMTVENIYKMKVVKKDGSNDSEGNGYKTILDALKDKQYDQVYLLLGANELGWVYPDMFITQYSKLIDTVRQLQPNAKICLQSILPVSQKRSNSDKVFNNDRIESYNKMIMKLAADKGIPYLNAAEALKDETGALPEAQTPDGIHLGGEACRKWRDYIKTHTMK